MTTVDAFAVARSVESVRARIRTLGGGRAIELIAVTKGFGADAIEAVIAAGCTAIGENYAQELLTKMANLGADAASEPVHPEVHFIGRLQTNKVRMIASLVDVWQSVDRVSLVDELARRAPGARVFVQVNTTGEPPKGGCEPAATIALVQHCRDAQMRVEGLMTVGPTSSDVAATHAAFALLRKLSDDVGVGGCSMGMSADLDIAIEHGATHVRIGNALFGARPQPRAHIG